MSFLDSIFKTGSNSPTMQQPAPAPQSPAPAPELPAEPATPDPFESLWQADDKQGTAPGLNFNLDPEQLAQIAGKIDYSTAITPEIRQRIAQGGEDAMAATLEAMNLVGRQGYQQNAIATTKLIEAAVKDTKATMGEEIKKQIRLMGLSDSVAESNPALSNPAFAPIVAAAKQQIITKFPNATQAEQLKMLNQYLNKAGEAFNPDLVKKANAPRDQFGNSHEETNVDWLAFLQ